MCRKGTQHPLATSSYHAFDIWQGITIQPTPAVSKNDLFCLRFATTMDSSASCLALDQNKEWKVCCFPHHLNSTSLICFTKLRVDFKETPPIMPTVIPLHKQEITTRISTFLCSLEDWRRVYSKNRISPSYALPSVLAYKAQCIWWMIQCVERDCHTCRTRAMKLPERNRCKAEELLKPSDEQEKYEHNLYIQRFTFST